MTHLVSTSGNPIALEFASQGEALAHTLAHDGIHVIQAFLPNGKAGDRWDVATSNDVTRIVKRTARSY